MWILPNNLSTISPSALDTLELGLDLNLFSQHLERSAMWRSKPAASSTWLQRCKRESSLQLLSSQILKPSHSESFLERWISSLEDSHANPSQMLANVNQQKIPDICFHTSSEESESANLPLFSLKMLKESSLAKPSPENQFSNMSAQSWKEWVIRQRQEYSQRLKLGIPTTEKESSSWVTPTSRDWKDNMTILKPRKDGKERKDQLPTQMAHLMKDQPELFPTPTAMEAEKAGNYSKGQMGQSLSAKAKRGELQHPQNNNMIGNVPELWATPRSTEYLCFRKKEVEKGAACNLNIQVLPGSPKNNEDLKKNKWNLNPDWVEQLMGLPVGWTNFEGAKRIDRLRMLGNGVVPQTATRAFATLFKRIIK